MPASTAESVPPESDAWEWRRVHRTEGSTEYIEGYWRPEPRDWREPAAAMELYKHMPAGCLEKHTNTQSGLVDYHCRTTFNGYPAIADTPEVAIALAYHASL